MRIVPAIDIMNGKCVRLTKGNFDTMKTYNENPLEVAREFEANGIEYLHLVDLDGAKSDQIIHYKILQQIATHTKLRIDFGGGIKSENDVRIAFENGAAQITAGSIAKNNPELFKSWLNVYGNEKIILGADAQNRKIATHGWLQSSDTDVVQFISDWHAKGIEYVICTDIARDGTLQGAAVDLYTEILQQVPVKLIASGGISGMADLFNMKNIGCEAAIIGKAIYEGKISLPELQKHISLLS